MKGFRAGLAAGLRAERPKKKKKKSKKDLEIAKLKQRLAKQQRAYEEDIY